MEENAPGVNRYETHKYVSFDAIMILIESHSGIWSPSPHLEPNDFWTQLVHHVDYIVSRSFIHINVD